MEPSTERKLALGHGCFDPLSGVLSIDGSSTKLRPRTAMLLAHLLRHAGRVVTKDELMQAVWPDAIVTEDSLVQCVKEIRHALGSVGHDWIRTVPRQGYAVVVSPADEPPTSAVDPVAGETDSANSLADARLRQRWPAAVLIIALAAVAGLAWHPWSVTRDDSPSIVVLPIVNQTGDSAREFAVEDLTESLTTALAREPGLLVIAPGTAFTFKDKAVDVRQVGAELHVRYVIEGSLRASGASPLLTLRLSEAASARQLWNEDFAADSGVAILQDAVRERIARSLSVRLARVEAQRWQREPTRDPIVTEQLARVRGMLRWSGRDRDMVMQARALLEDTLKRDSNSAEAWTLLVKTQIHNVRFSPAREQQLRLADEASTRALALAPDSVEAQVMRAWVLYETRRMPEALAAFDRGVELAPNVPHLLAGRGAALIMLGRPDEAIDAIDRALRLSPRDPFIASWLLFRGVADLHAGRAEASVAWLRRSLEAEPASPFGHLFLASALASAGQIDAAREQMAQFQRLLPGFSLHQFREREPSDAPAFKKQRERVYQGLLLAGMPE